MENVAQAEFFLAGAHGKSLDEFSEELRSRRESGSNIKTVVRFVDVSGELTKAAIEAQTLCRIDAIITRGFSKKNWFMRKLVSFQVTYLARAIARRKRDCRIEALKQLRQSIQNSKVIAVETSNHHFREAQKNELHELLESASRAENMWLFVFKPADLLADTNKLVASVM